METVIANNTDTVRINLKTHRFVFSETVSECLAEFARIHEHDDRKVFKEEWKEWLEEEDIKTMVEEEINRIRNSGFTGDVVDKMFKSSRYYYRKKKETKNEDERKPYETICKDVLKEMDMDILTQMRNNSKLLNNELYSEITPADCFNNYLLENKKMILENISKSEKVSREDVEEIVNKYKKIYKNRFYKIRVRGGGNQVNLRNPLTPIL